MVAQEKLEKITFVTIKSQLKTRDTQKELYNTVALKNNHEAQRPLPTLLFYQKCIL